MERIWPICPQPLPMEAMSSWLFRVGNAYWLSVPELLDALGLAREAGEDIDLRCKPALLRQLSFHSGLSTLRLRKMSLAALVAPAFIAAEKDVEGHLLYSRYVSGFRVLPLVKDPGESVIKMPPIPWKVSSTAPPAVCPMCLLEDIVPYIRMGWTHGLVVSCPTHKVTLLPQTKFMYEKLVEENRSASPAFESCDALLRLDSMTEEALMRGRLQLSNGNVVSARWWMRFLRAFLDELARAEEHHRWGLVCQADYQEIWTATGSQPPTRTNANFSIESMDAAYRVPLFRAAAVGIDMIMRGDLKPPDVSRARVLVPKDPLSLKKPPIWDLTGKFGT